MKILGCDWDAINREKVELHELDPDHVEEMLTGDDLVVIPHTRIGGRWIALGFVGDRFILVPFDYDAALFWARPVTAYEAESEYWFRRYEEETARHRGRP